MRTISSAEKPASQDGKVADNLNLPRFTCHCRISSQAPHGDHDAALHLPGRLPSFARLQSPFPPRRDATRNKKAQDAVARHVRANP